MSRISHFFATVLCFLSGLSRSGAAEVYSIPLKNDGEAKLYWTVDYAEEVVQFEVHVPMSQTSWFAIGFSDYGEPESADFCIFWTDWMRTQHFQDTWTDESGRIRVDRRQDCLDFLYKWHDGTLKFTFSRKFQTCDSEDYAIDDGTTHVVWMEGKGPLFAVEGVNVSSSVSNGFERTQLLKAQNTQVKHPEDTWTLEVLANKVRVPDVETTYWCHVHELPESLKNKHHVIQYEPVIQKGNEHIVHHMEVFHCETDVKEEIPNYVGPCFAEDRPEKTKVCKRVIAAWAMGAGPFSYPKEAGLPIGGPEYNQFVMLEVHYNNPGLTSGVIDSSGVRLYLTPSLREYDGGVIELGLEYTDKMAIPPGQSAFQLSGFCVSECTAVSLPESGIVVFGAQLHTHLLGVRAYTKHMRKGIELRELSRDNHYSTHFQEIRRLKRDVRILPGDALIVTCTYRTSDKQNITFGGFAIADEMCVSYIHYYPKSDLEVCKSSVSYEDLYSYFDYLRKYEYQDTDSKKAITENYKSIEWTPVRVQVLSDLYTEGTLSMQCNRSSGERFPGDWEGMHPSKILKPLQTRPECPTP
ncbi:UNVERIFIED_CONTAM: hypothetical protein PYX00_003309 [Menopon gallinae]|uniref:Dopamine beta-hydroxylase n=1 Tax=Menopon gallinae TaxID=328185 RepID=A0AAW2HZJ3_9NEOP